MVTEAVSTDFCEHKTIRELTHCATGIYVLLSAPPTRGLRASDRIRRAHVTHSSHVVCEAWINHFAQFERKPGRTGEREERQSPVTATPRPP